MTNKLSFIALLLCVSSWFSGFLVAQNMKNKSLGNWTSTQNVPNGVLLQTTFGKIQITAYSPDMIRVRAVKDDFGRDFSYSVVYQAPAVAVTVKEDAEKITLTTATLRTEISKNPVRIQFFSAKGILLNEDDKSFGISWIGDQVSNYKKLQPQEKFIGLGEKSGNLNRAGEGYTNWNTDAWLYTAQTDPLYGSYPFYLGIHSGTQYGIFFDNTHRSHFNFGASNNRFASFGADGGEMNYYFIHQENVSKIIEAYTLLTGRMSLPPLWSLGYQQCRYSYYPDKEVLNMAKTFREKQIPADVLYLDIHYMDNYKVFTWHPQRFPQPQKMLKELKDLGFKTVIIIDPGIKVEAGYEAYTKGLQENAFVNYPDGTSYTGAVWAGWSHFPDFTKPTARKWWGNSFKGYVQDGVMGFWNDMNEPSTWGQKMPDLIEFDFEGEPTTHLKARNVYGMQMARSTYEGVKGLMNNQRPFILTRSGFSGVQRYSAVWTGDNTSSDDNMLMGIRLLNSMGLAGLSYVGYDVGGFIGEPSKELFGRWVSIATFSPFMRGHTMVDTKDQEPWSFGERIEDLSRNYISLRYKLLPYLYSSFYEATQNGLPVQRSLAIDYTHDARIYENKYQHQYLFGKNLLVAPVESIKEITKVLLPTHEGGWYDFYTDKHYAGNMEVLEEAPLDSLPVFVKAGAILPMQSVVQNTTEKGDKTLYLHVYKGTQPTDFVYYEDDGESYNYEKGEFLKRKITYNPDKKEIVLEAVEGNFTSKFDQIQFVLHQVTDKAKSLTINGKAVETQTVTVEMMKPLLDFSVNPAPSIHKITQNVGVKVANEKGRIVVKW